jgi:hypothetical protein
MAQILDPLPPEQAERILCCYVNATNKIQVARISNISNWYFERVIFPGQRLIFEAPQAAQMEIHTGMIASAILSDTIPCDRLAINESSYQAQDTSLTTEIEPINANLMVQSINTKIGDTTKPLQVIGLASVD